VDKKKSGKAISPVHSITLATLLHRCMVDCSSNKSNK